MLTYNHASFIRQAIESVLMQQVSFAFELIIGEDCSTDQTRRIVAEYAQQYPHLIVPIYHAANVGMGANLKACLAASKGRYLAPVEGDDYWTDPGKLQKQVAFLDTHSEYAMCFHEVQVVQGDSASVRGITRNEQTYNFTELLASERTIPMTCSLLLRNHRLAFPDWLFTVATLDYPLVIMQAEHGKLWRLDGVMSVYRKHQAGVWSSVSAVVNRRRYIYMYECLAQHYGPTPHAGAVRQALYRHCLSIADSLVLQGLPHEATHFLQRALAARPRLQLSNLKSLLGVSARWGLAQVSSKSSTSHSPD